MDITELTKQLHEKINAATTLEDILILTKALEKLSIGRVNSVATYIDLLEIQDAPKVGELYYVETESKLYYNYGDSWITILNATSSFTMAFGQNLSGRLGDNTTVSKNSPVSVVGGFTDWISISAGGDHSLGVRASGTLWAWGSNSFGKLGDGTTVAKSSPTLISSGLANWVRVSAGDAHSLGIKTDGSAWAWGDNSLGRLGDGTVTTKSSPVSVVGNLDWFLVSAGFEHSLGITSNGIAWGWGQGSTGKLGNGTTANVSSPVSVIGGFTDWVLVSAGGNHSAGIRSNGTAWGWGNNNSGRLGDNTVVAKSSPVSVAGDFTDWKQLSAGYAHTVGVRANGTAWGWGANGAGTVGDGTQFSRSAPTLVVGGFTDWLEVSASQHTLGLRANGTAWSWGFNGNGQLGDGTAVSKLSPVSVVGNINTWLDISAGSQHSLGIKT